MPSTGQGHVSHSFSLCVLKSLNPAIILFKQGVNRLFYATAPFRSFVLRSFVDAAADGDWEHINDADAFLFTALAYTDAPDTTDARRFVTRVSFVTAIHTRVDEGPRFGWFELNIDGDEFRCSTSFASSLIAFEAKDGGEYLQAAP